MPKQKNDSTPSPAKPETPESTTGAAEATVSKDAAGAESQAAPIASDRLEDTATSPVMQDTFGNPDMPEQTTDANPSPAEAGTEVSTSPQSPHDDMPEAEATRDEAGAESQVPAAPSNPAQNNLPQTAEGYLKQPAELDDGGCFDPFIPQVPEPHSPKRTPVLLWELMDAAPELLPPLTDTPVEAPLPPPQFATAAQLILWIKLCFLAQTHLPEDAAELAAFYVISTWFQDQLNVLPCLVLTGAAHDAMVVLRVLSTFCRKAKLLSGFRRSHLGVLRWGCMTNLVWEPNLDKRMAALLSNLTDRNFVVVERRSLISCAKSTAIYAGENPETHKIQNSIRIHIAPTNAGPPARPQWPQKTIERVTVHLDQYRDRNLNCVCQWTWFPSGLSAETAAIATALESCIVDAPELRQTLLALLKTQDQQRLSAMSNTTEAVVVEATLALSRDGREYAYAKEIAAAANRLREARGETARLRPENVGHQLKGLGLRTRRLSQTGNGLTFDKATVAQIQQLATVYLMEVMEVAPAETENLNSSQTTEKNQVEEVMEVMEVMEVF